jgi:hypothetical protein
MAKTMRKRMSLRKKNLQSCRRSKVRMKKVLETLMSK